ncbi:MAG: isoprenylcysteine carboxylmethyltransferase family protein [Rhodobacteraceae bacterium]|nr:isoprenylcysteine carboxylmethyltransferase family protein [Paracoccaceae bacterium]
MSESDDAPQGSRFDLPPVWLAGFLALAWALDRLTPGLRIELLSPSWSSRCGWALIFAALTITFWAAWCFWRARTSIIPGESADALVTSGPYRWSRNPIYLADAMILLGQAALLQSFWPILFTPLFGWVMERRFILPEEIMLRERFPQAFADWSARVRRWV